MDYELERLRDMFAAAALMGLIAIPGLDEERAAKRAYDQAEAMMKERASRYPTDRKPWPRP